MKNLNFKINLMLFALIIVLSFGLLIAFCGLSTSSVSAEAVETEIVKNLDNSSNFEKVISYEDIFREYYQKTTDMMAEYNIDMPYNYEEFCDGYYKFGMDLNNYCNFLVAEANGSICMADYEISPMSSSDDEDYIIKGDTSNPSSPNFDPAITPSSALQRDIYYTNNLFDYSAIQEGDIVIETSTKFNNMGHSAFVYDVNKPASGKIHGRNTYIQVIEAVHGGVQFGFLDDKRMVDFGVIIIRPIGTTSDIVEKAKAFHKNQLGKPYNLPLSEGRANTGDSESWYCSELNYAGYYDSGLIIAQPSYGGWIWAFDLVNSIGTRYVSFSNTLDARLCGKTNGKWQIRVYNYTGNSVDMYYNSKLAFEGDAKNWSGLKDVNATSIKIYNNSYVDIYVSTNVFATTAAISHTIGNRRYITYCNELHNSTLRMSVYKNVI